VVAFELIALFAALGNEATSFLMLSRNNQAAAPLAVRWLSSGVLPDTSTG
jgi:hypothetical protein